MNPSANLAEAARARGVTRLCHLTPSQNLVHIASGQGIRSTTLLESDKRASFTAQDQSRVDGHLGHISCSIQYPNPWYFRHKRNPLGEAANFADWVVLGIDAACMSRPDTLFCPFNAAGGGGAHLVAGLDGFEELYAAKIADTAGRIFERTDDRLSMCPTNDQAEVMVYNAISPEEIRTLFVADTAQAARHYAQLEQIGADPGQFRYVIAPKFFEPEKLSANMRDGLAPDEIEWNPPG